MEVFGYDFDGVVSIGIKPRFETDIIITGRCIDEKDYVTKELRKLGIKNRVYLNPMTLEERGNHTVDARLHSGFHKSFTIKELSKQGIKVIRFFEDDEIQKGVIQENHPKLDIVHIVSNLTKK